MKAQIMQTRVGSSALSTITRGAETIHNAITTVDPVQVDITLLTNGEESFRIHGGSGNARVEIQNLAPQKEHPIKVCVVYSPQGERVGFVRYAMGGWRDIPCFRLDLNGRQWVGYQVGLGRQGIKFPIYDQCGRQVALLERDVVMKNGQDVYQMSVLNDEDAVPALLLGLYYDWKTFMCGQQGGRKSQVTMVTTTNRRQKEKYDPAFSSRCLP